MEEVDVNENEDDNNNEDDEDNKDNKDNKEEEEEFFCKNAWNDQMYQPAKFGAASSMGTS